MENPTNQLTQSEIVAAWKAKIITGDKAMALMEDKHAVQELPQAIIQSKLAHNAKPESHKKQAPAFLRKQWNAADTKQLVTLRDAGKSYKQCAKLLGRTAEGCQVRYGRTALNWVSGRHKEKTNNRQLL